MGGVAGLVGRMGWCKWGGGVGGLVVGGGGLVSVMGRGGLMSLVGWWIVDLRPTWSLVTDLVGQLGPDVLQAVQHGPLHPGLEAADAIEGLSQLVGLAVALRRRQVGRTEAAQ